MHDGCVQKSITVKPCGPWLTTITGIEALHFNEGVAHMQLGLHAQETGCSLQLVSVTKDMRDQVFNALVLSLTRSFCMHFFGVSASVCHCTLAGLHILCEDLARQVFDKRQNIVIKIIDSFLFLH